MLTCADNTGARKLMCIGIPGSNRRIAGVGDVVTAVVKGASSHGTVKDGAVVRALIVRTAKEIRRKDGSYIRFDENGAVVVDKERNPVGTRVFGPIAREIKEKGFDRIASMAPEVY